jgi:NADH-quinone oxidoreductase subunit L
VFKHNAIIPLFTFINCLFLVLLCFARTSVHPVVSFNSRLSDMLIWQAIIKVYLFYTITIFNLLASFMFINYYECIEIYIIAIVNMRSSTLANFILLTVLLVSSCVVINSIDYLSIIDSYLFLCYILMFQFTMVIFILTHDLILSFLYWEILGIISYLLISFWSARINCGVKALIFNKLGDCSFILVLALAYSYLSFVSYYPFLSFSLIFSLFFSCILSYSHSYIIIQLALIIICFTKSAQMPFSS